MQQEIIQGNTSAQYFKQAAAVRDLCCHTRYVSKGKEYNTHRNSKVGK